MTDYRVDDLARVAGTTVRNVRAYQDRGLLPAPRKEGRVVWYSEVHLERLRSVLDLLDRGYTLASISELLDAEAEGLGVDDLVRLGQAIFEPYEPEEPRRYGLTELAELFGGTSDALDALNRAVDLGVIRRDGDHFVASAPGLLDACRRLVEVGVPVDAAVDTFTTIRERLQPIADAMVDLVATHVIEPRLLADGTPRILEADEAGALADVVSEVRPIAHSVVAHELGGAIERAVTQRVRARLG